MKKIPFLFAIPLIAKSVAKDWDRVCSLLAVTLDSILNQTDSDFVVVLACHDVPNIPQLNDPRIVVLKTISPIPQTPDEQMLDKGHKKRMAFSYLHALGGGWAMLVDADDLVSNQLINYVRKTDAKFGLIIDQGWEFDCRTRKLTQARRFNRMCGSSGIFRFAQQDLPNNALQKEKTLSDAYESHREWREISLQLERPLDFVSFKAAIYTINNQQNHSDLSSNIGWKRRAIRFFSASHKPSKKEIEEFSLYKLLN